MRHASHRAFTLIELLVVVAIIAMLLSILLPSLSGAREAAKAAVCGQQMRGFGGGLATYLAENSDWIPGVNTSGVAIQSLENTPSAGNIDAYAKSKMPVQMWDWMTPVVCYQTELPSPRAERFKFLLDKFRCPSQRYTSAFYFDGVIPDQQACIDSGPWPSVSYLMPWFFQYWGSDLRERYPLATREDGTAVNPRTPGASWEVRMTDYVSKLERIGSPGQKIFVADGTRYLQAGKQVDSDVTCMADYGGCFADSGGWWCGSTAYGVAVRTRNWDNQMMTDGACPAQGHNLPLSYRHRSGPTESTNSVHDNKGSMNAVFFDGHVQRMNDRESRKVEYWYPKGCVIPQPSLYCGLSRGPDTDPSTRKAYVP